VLHYRKSGAKLFDNRKREDKYIKPKRGGKKVGTKIITLAQVKRGYVISHPLRKKGRWLVKNITSGGSVHPGRLESLLIEKIGREDIKDKFTLRSLVTALEISRHEVTLHGIMEEVTVWKWKRRQ